MRIPSSILRVARVGVFMAAGTTLALAQTPQARGFAVAHPAIGSWFGRAVQLCAFSDTKCFKVALFMTPTLTGDGQFIGNDSLALGGPPFGPHTTAHGRWVPVSNTDIIADYVFMLPGTTAASLSAVRFRWEASTVGFDSMVGFVNIFFGPEIPIVWEDLTAPQFPSLPAETIPTLTPPAKFYKDPAFCATGPPACPLIFKFKINRVSQ